jgi:hypothetical protein
LRKHLLVPFGRGFAAVLLSTFPVAAMATPENFAESSVRVYAVTTPNQPQGIVANDNHRERWIAPNLMTATAHSQADSGVTGTLGFAAGSALAVGGPGVLRASAFAESQAVAQPNTPVGAGVVSEALAEFTDSIILTTNPPVYQNLLIATGNLVLTGNIVGSGAANVRVGGTGLNPQQASGQWFGEPGRQKSAFGVYSPWTPGDPVIIPISFTAYVGQAIDLTYYLGVYASSGSSFSQPCTSLGGLCNPLEVMSKNIASDYGNTLVWGGLSVTDWFGNPVAFSVSSNSGFDYSPAYVPEPGTTSLLMIGLSWLGWRARRRTGAATQMAA